MSPWPNMLGQNWQYLSPLNRTSKEIIASKSTLKAKLTNRLLLLNRKHREIVTSNPLLAQIGKKCYFKQEV